MFYVLKVSVVACRNNKQRFNQLSKMYDGRGIEACLSSFQFTPDMDFNKFVTLWIFSLCLVEKSRTDRTSSSSPEIQVVENGVSGKLLIILALCEYTVVFCSSTMSLAEKHHCFGRECLCHISDGAGTICSPAENSPAGSPMCSPSLNYQIHCRWLFICVMLIVMASVSKPLWFAAKCAHLYATFFLYLLSLSYVLRIPKSRSSQHLNRKIFVWKWLQFQHVIPLTDYDFTKSSELEAAGFIQCEPDPLRHVNNWAFLWHLLSGQFMILLTVTCTMAETELFGISPHCQPFVHPLPVFTLYIHAQFDIVRGGFYNLKKMILYFIF